VTTLFTPSARHAPILEKDGPRFKWAQEEGMHVLVSGTKEGARNAAKTDHLRKLAEEVWGDDRGLKYTEVITRLKAKCRIKDSGAEEKFTDLNRLGVITKQINLWQIAA